MDRNPAAHHNLLNPGSGPPTDPTVGFKPYQQLYPSRDKPTAEANWYQGSSSSSSHGAGAVQSTHPRRGNSEYPEGGEGKERTQQYGGRPQAGSDGTRMQISDHSTVQQVAPKATPRDDTPNQGGKLEMQQATIAEVRPVKTITV